MKTDHAPTESARSSLTGLAVLASKTADTEKGILTGALQRLDIVNAAITRQRIGIDGAEDAAQDRYLALIKERGKLNTVISKARLALKS